LGKNAGIQGAAGDYGSRRFEIGRGGRWIQQGEVDIRHFLPRRFGFLPVFPSQYQAGWQAVEDLI
jgi:hypothetical protein